MNAMGFEFLSNVLVDIPKFCECDPIRLVNYVFSIISEFWSSIKQVDSLSKSRSLDFAKSFINPIEALLADGLGSVPWCRNSRYRRSLAAVSTSKFLDLDGVTIAHRKSNDCQAEASVELMTAGDHSSRGIKPRNAPKQHIKAGIVAIDHE